MTERVVLLIVAPLLGAALCLPIRLLPRGPWAARGLWAARGVSLAVLLAGLLLAAGLHPAVRGGASLLYPVGGWGLPMGIMLRLDGPAWLGSVIVLVIVLAALVYSFDDSVGLAAGEPGYGPDFYFFLLILLAGLQGALLTEDLFNLFVFLEMVGLATYVLIAWFRTGPSLLASFRYLVISTTAISFFLIGIYIFYRATGLLSLSGIAAALAPPAAGGGPAPVPAAVLLGTVALVVGVGVRTAFIPFHTWLPEAHGSAPHPVSAILSGVVIKVSFLVLWRILAALPLGQLVRSFVWIGAATAAGGVLLALVQVDTKRLLAFHSISQMGYILAAFGAGSPAARSGSLYHVISHALFKSLLFLSVGAVIACTGEKSLKRLGGLGRRLPLLLVPFIAAALAISGLPPWNGYVSKKLILAGVRGYPVAYWTLWAVGVGTVASFLKLSGMFRRTRLSLPHGVIEPRRPGVWRVAPLLVLAVLCLATGLWPSFWARVLLLSAPGAVYTAGTVLEALLAAGVGVGVFLLVTSRRGERLSARLRTLRLGLDGGLYLLVGGLLALAAAAVLAAPVRFLPG